jgi:hypothetical protein
MLAEILQPNRARVLAPTTQRRERMPTAVLIRRRGSIVERKAGAADVTASRRSIATLLAES